MVIETDGQPIMEDRLTPCNACGCRNEADATFCDQCGTKLKSQSEARAIGTSSRGRQSLLLGAAADCDLILDHQAVSSHHILVLMEPDTYFLYDLNSTNGTTVGGKPVPRSGIEVSRSTTLELVLGTHQVDPLTLRKAFAHAPRTHLVGRTSEADLCLDLPAISARHFIVRKAGTTGARGEFIVMDLLSSNGLFLEEAESHERWRIHGLTRVTSTDVLFLGSYRLPVSLLMRRINTDTTDQAPDATKLGTGRVPVPEQGELIRLSGDAVELILGRAAECDVVVPSPQVSGRHVRIRFLAADACSIEDLGSSNGTFLEGKRIKNAETHGAFTLTLGSFPIHLDLKKRELTVGLLLGSVRLDAIGVSRIVRHRETGQPVTLVDDVSVSIYPSELVGLMGPSGAGKTTLMLALNGYEPPSTGQVLINGDDLYAHFNQYRGLIGYVPQDDIMHGRLTVSEALYYTARLRLPPDTRRAEIRKDVARVLEELKLTEQAHLLIGSPEEKVLSGGQRKRVNVAMELVTQPVLLFLDEPTSGLSARDTVELMEVLRGLADDGRTIILTIHQPSADVFGRMDNVIQMAKGGRLAYFGPTEPESYQYFGVDSRNPDLIMDRMEDRTPTEWKERYRASTDYDTYVEKRQARSPNRNALKTEVARRGVRVPRMGQWWTLLRRYARIKLRDRSNLVFMLAQAPLVGLLLALAFHDADIRYSTRSVPIFILCISIVFFGCMNACREIVSERAIFRRERMVNLLLGPYLMSKFVVLALIGVAQGFLLLMLAQAWVGLEGDTQHYLLLLSGTSFAATALGLLISSLVKSAEAAMTAVPIVLVFQIVLAGMLIPLHGQDKEYIEYLAAPMIARWSLEALLDVEREGLMGQFDENRKEVRGEIWRKVNMEQNNLTPKRSDTDLLILGAFTLACLLACGWRLRREERG